MRPPQLQVQMENILGFLFESGLRLHTMFPNSMGETLRLGSIRIFQMERGKYTI